MRQPATLAGPPGAVARAASSVVQLSWDMKVRTGLVVLESGLIATCRSFDGPAGGRVLAETADGRVFRIFPVAGFDRFRVAFFHVLGGEGGGKPIPARFGAGRHAVAGRPAYLLGNPLGLGSRIVRATIRKPPAVDVPAGLLGLDWLHSDLEPSSGGYGSPLVNGRGEVIGLQVFVTHPPGSPPPVCALPGRRLAVMVAYLREFLDPARFPSREICPVCGGFSPSREYYCGWCGARLLLGRDRKEILHRCGRM